MTIKPYDAFIPDLDALNTEAEQAVAAGSPKPAILVPRTCPLAVVDRLPAFKIDEVPSLITSAKGTAPAAASATQPVC